MNQPTAASLSPAARRSMFGGAFMMFIDTFDIYLPAFILPAIIGYFIPKSLPASIQVTVSTLIFTSTLLGRPLGGLIFGPLSDKYGRKKVAMLASAGFTAVTFVLSIMPGYAQWGYVSVVLFILLRFLDGIFLGGGYASALPLALERSPIRMRGLVGGVMAASAVFSVIAINIIQYVLLLFISRDEYTAWGWRLPFLVGVLLGVVYLFYYAGVPELEFKALRGTHAKKQPLGELLGNRQHVRKAAILFLMMTGYWFSNQMALSLLPSLMMGYLHVPASIFTKWAIVANVAVMIAVVAFGVLSQKIGRRRMLMIFGVAITLSPFIYHTIVGYGKGAPNAVGMGIAISALMIVASGSLGVVITYLNECFPTRMRSTGYSLAYYLSVIVPGLYSFWLLGLQKFMPYEYTPLVLECVGGLLFLLSAWAGPETRDVDLLAIAEGRADTHETDSQRGEIKRMPGEVAR
ncbi:MFS transporter [Trinickia sp.]|uniref:MFS transporter n=1 Tax=Trinickia sp. TaxID=2571163 RepID=UPI003F7DF8CC